MIYILPFSYVCVCIYAYIYNCMYICLWYICVCVYVYLSDGAS